MLAGITRLSGTVLQVVRSKTKGITKSGLANECGFIFLLPQFCKHPESAFERIAPPHRSLPILRSGQIEPEVPALWETTQYVLEKIEKLRLSRDQGGEAFNRSLSFSC